MELYQYETSLNLHQMETRIFVDDFILQNEYNLSRDNNKNIFVTYYQTKTKETHKVNIPFTYKEALNFARKRANDKRYKNFHLFIQYFK